MTTSMYAAIELGGTKTICLVGESLDNLHAQLVIPTSTPAETLTAAAQFFADYAPLKSIGIGTFGPVELNPLSSNYGSIQATPKKGWSHVNVRDFFVDKFACPVFIDTDVNAAAIGEYHLGAAQGLANFIYVTVGTGIGAGAVINGRPVQGLSHPEMGHINLLRAKGDESFIVSCPFHKDCAEGLASGSAIYKRWGAALNKLPENSLAWELQAYYLSEFSHTLTLLYSPQRIIFGGGVSSEPLLARMRHLLVEQLNGYVQPLNSLGAMQTYLTLPALGDKAGPYGSFLLNFGGT